MGLRESSAYPISKKQEFAEAWKLLEPRIRDPKWFEALQLLGGEWAKSSDESLDRYVAQLLEVRGKTVAKEAPIVALCANVLQDAEGVAEVRSETRKEFETAVKATLHAFRKNSKVPEKTQLEIVEALGQLGAAAKPHMITATKAQRYAVRKRVIEIIVPHIPDDDFFALKHILADRSYVPVTTYCQAVIERDPTRALGLLASGLMNDKHSRVVVRLHLAVYIAFLETESKVGSERALHLLMTARPPRTTPELFELLALHAPGAPSRESLETAVFSSGWQRRSKRWGRTSPTAPRRSSGSAKPPPLPSHGCARWRSKRWGRTSPTAPRRSSWSAKPPPISTGVCARRRCKRWGRTSPTAPRPLSSFLL